MWGTIDHDGNNRVDRNEFEHVLFWTARHRKEGCGRCEVEDRLQQGAENFGSLCILRQCFGEDLIVTCQRCGKAVSAFKMVMHAVTCEGGAQEEQVNSGDGGGRYKHEENKVDGKEEKEEATLEAGKNEEKEDEEQRNSADVVVTLDQIVPETSSS